MAGATFRRLIDRKIKSLKKSFNKMKRSLWIIAITEGQYNNVKPCCVCSHDFPDVIKKRFPDVKNHKFKWMIKCPVCKTHTKPSYCFMDVITRWNLARSIPYDESLVCNHIRKI